MADKLKTRFKRLPRKAWRLLMRAFWGHIYIDDHADKPVVLISGSGRSGTTWLSNIVNYNNQYRYIFEPFHPKWVKLPDFFVEYKYLSPEDKPADYHQFIDNVYHGRVNGYYANRHNRKLVAKQRLIKDIHSNLMLKWVTVNFPEIPVVLLMRHPLSVVKSRYNLKWGPRISFINDKDLVKDFPEIIDICEKFTEKFDCYVIKWCIENYVPLAQLGSGQAHVVFYEDLCVDPQAQTEKLFNYLGKEYSPKTKKAIQTPSEVSRKDSAIRTGANMVEGYQKHFSPQQIDRAMQIIQAFGLDKIYGPGPMPKIDGQKALQLFNRS